MSTDRTSTAVREARRNLAAKIRDDWQFDWDPKNTTNGYIPPGGITSTGSQSIPLSSVTANFAFSSPHETSLRPDLASVQDWRERNYASSDPSSHSSDEDDSVAMTRNLTTPSVSYRTTPTSPMDLDAKDQDPRAEETRKSDRRKRRRRRLDEEMSWNEGLAHWTARRDAWCCAKLVQRGGDDPLVGPYPSTQAYVSEMQNQGEEQVPEYIQGSNQDDKQPTRVASNEEEQYPAEFTQHLQPPSLTLEHGSSDHSKNLELTSSDPSSTTSTTTGTTAATETFSPFPTRPALPVRAYTSLVPLAPPILAQDDPTYTNITSALYPSIYSKVVTRSLTPSIPINLSHMVRALVQGWKDDGEWPPKTSHDSTLHNQTVGAGRTIRGGSKDGAGGGSGGGGLRGGAGRAKRLLERHRRIDSSGSSVRRAVAAAVGNAEGGADERRREGEALARIKGDEKSGTKDSLAFFGLDGTNERTGSVHPDLQSGSTAATGDDHNGMFRKGVAKVSRALRLSISESAEGEERPT